MKKRFVKQLISTALAFSLFATPVFAAGGSASDREDEPNNTMETASRSYFHAANYDYIYFYGALNSTKDTDDWFKIKYETDKSGYKKVNSTFMFDGTPEATYEVSVFDYSGNLRGNKVIASKGSMTLWNIMVGNGEYIYIHVKLVDGDPYTPYRIMLATDKLYK